jgi:hypothetical protein
MQKQLWARMLKARCKTDEESYAKLLDNLRHATIPHITTESGYRQAFFFVDRDHHGGTTDVFSITIYTTEDDLNQAMETADSEFRWQTLLSLEAYPLDARTFDVVAGAINPDAPEVDLLS